MRKYFLLLMMFLPLCVQAQTNFEPKQRDVFNFHLGSTSSTYKETLGLYTDNDMTTAYQPSIDAVPQTEYPLGFFTRSSDGYRLLKYKRPYEPGNYYADFPLSVKLESGQEYKFWVQVGSQNKAAVIFRLIDTSHPDEFIDLVKRESYIFTADKTGVDDDRFSVRVYAASILKENPVDNRWENPDNWEGEVPGLNKKKSDGIGITNNCAIIPAGREVVISHDEEITIGTLLNSGSLIIEKGAVLNIVNEAQL